MDFDVIVIGGGSAGYAAARTSADSGARVAIVDKGPLGGLCILRGCMPSKTLLRSSDVMSLVRRAREFGIRVGPASVDMAAINDRKRALISEFADYRIGQLKSPRFTLLRGRAQFINSNTLRVGKSTFTARSFVIATGSNTASISISGLEDVGYITSDEALDLRILPKSMIVLGGGAVAAELGQFFCRMGTRTTLIQRSQHLFSGGDEDVARPVEAKFREEGMTVHTGTQLIKFTRTKKTITAHFKKDGKIRRTTADYLLQAMGRSPALEGLGLEQAGVAVEKGRILVDERMGTSKKHIFAAGDCVGLYEIVHIAVEQGEIAGHNAVAGTRKKFMDYRLRSEVTFTDPQVAFAGPSEKACKANGIQYLVAQHAFDDHGKSMTMGETHGFVKLLCNPVSGELIAAHIVGPDAAELIHELVSIMYFRGTVRDILRIPHYHPTLSEIITYPAEELSERIAAC